jgi:hypothetical protein
MLVSVSSFVGPAQAGELNTPQIEKLTGLKGKLDKEGIFKVSLPRSDIQDAPKAGVPGALAKIAIMA